MSRGTPAPEDRAISDDSIEQFATAVAVAALEKKAQDVVILDLRGRIDYADFFVLATARNPRQVRAIADSVKLVAKHEHDVRATGMEGQEAGRWVLADFGDVVLHVFDRDMRGFYDLDGLWRDAPRLPVPDVEVEADEDDLPEPFFTV
jgi:ribosome silencing factor RsfS/YbeB/iojap